MIKIQILILIFFPLAIYGQDWKSINADFNLSDSLTFPTEIRIYEGSGITNYNSMFRMYKDTSDIWTVELYEHWAKVEGIMEKKIQKRILTSESEMEYVYLNLFRSHIFDLPSRSDINWKLINRGKIEKIKQLPNRIGEEPKMQYEILSIVAMPLDGTGYYFQAKNSSQSNTFKFENPESFNELYPEIDEPQYVCELIEIIRSEFGIWKK